MPTFADLVSALQQSKPFKACGPDLIPPALCHSHARDLAKLLWPLLLKTVTQGSEPVGFKGGRLLHIPKPIAHDRSSTVSPAVAFSCSGIWRHCPWPIWSVRLRHCSAGQPQRRDSCLWLLHESQLHCFHQGGRSFRSTHFPSP